MSQIEAIFEQLIKTAVSKGISDIHLRTDERPIFRSGGELKPVKASPISGPDMYRIMRFLTNDAMSDQQIRSLQEYDGAFELSGVCRLRYNALRYQGKLGIVVRLISTTVPSIESLDLGPKIQEFAELRQGLVLVVGATGQGKSSTLAAIVHHINQNYSRHIITIEDPVEFIYTPIKSRITQREVGPDTDNFTTALRSALRQDPDVILVGELRDVETIKIAIKAAETGHLVLGTLHTTNVASTISRIISMHEPAEQQSVRARLSDCLKGVIAQRLVPRKEELGRLAAQEIMVNHPGIKECIMDAERLNEMYTYISKGKENYGTQTFDQHLHELYDRGSITLEDAKAHATSPEDFERNLIVST